MPHNNQMQRARIMHKGVLCRRHRRVADLQRYAAQLSPSHGVNASFVSPAVMDILV
jgi:hypothetical protein